MLLGSLSPQGTSLKNCGELLFPDFTETENAISNFLSSGGAHDVDLKDDKFQRLERMKKQSSKALVQR